MRITSNSQQKSSPNEKQHTTFKMCEEPSDLIVWHIVKMCCASLRQQKLKNFNAAYIDSGGATHNRVKGRGWVQRERHMLLCGRTQVCPCPPTLPPSGSQAVLISCGGPGSGGVMSEQEMNEVIVRGEREEAG